MRMGLGYVFIAILWCLFVLGVINLIDQGANVIDSIERSLVSFSYLGGSLLH